MSSQPLAIAGQNMLDLNGTWKVTWSDGVHGFTNNLQPGFQDPGRYIDVPVPLELHRAMQEKGLVEDPNIGINSYKARWVELQYWQYYTTFEAPAQALGQTAWLAFDQLDLIAKIYLNGDEIGGHENVNIPCRLDVTGKLKEGVNELAVLLDSGCHHVLDKPGADYQENFPTVLAKRHWLRKPQYQYGWDWNPWLANVGITGDVRLEWAESMRLDQTTAWAELAGDHSSAVVTVRAFVEGLDKDKAVPATLKVKVAETGQTFEQTVEIVAGLNPYEVKFTIDNPQLWWPIGHGEAFLYTLEICLEAAGAIVDAATQRFGVRSIEIDRSPHPETGEFFIIKVNGRRIFCKGGNWVPADMIYSAVDEQRIRDLVDLSVEANFNMLRIWGGGLFADHRLLGACDEKGILVWQDMLFACSKYPGDDPEFLAMIRREVTWASREYAYHPSLVVWCGNNELEWGVHGWGYDKSGRSLPDYALFHHAIPVILKQEDPMRPYWPSSPFSPDHVWPNDPTVGDQHPWGVSILDDGPNFWAYRQYVDRFPNEGGVLGATSPKTLRQFLPEGEQHLRSFSWEHHENSLNLGRAEPGSTYQIVKMWLGRDYDSFDFDTYVFASALLHAEGLTEYITNYHRRMFSSSSAVFWMYNDSWPVTHGWTIIDYYLRKKLAYHPVRRAFEQLAVVVADEGDRITVYGVNETAEVWQGTLSSGLFALGGGYGLDESKAVTLAPEASTLLAEFTRGQWDTLGTKTHGAFALLTDADGTVVARHRMFVERFKDLAMVDPEIEVEREDGKVTFTSKAFVWGLTLDMDGEAPIDDNCFDLLPGVPYTVDWPEEADDPIILRTGNELIG